MGDWSKVQKYITQMKELPGAPRPLIPFFELHLDLHVGDTDQVGNDAKALLEKTESEGWWFFAAAVLAEVARAVDDPTGADIAMDSSDNQLGRGYPKNFSLPMAVAGILAVHAGASADHARIKSLLKKLSEVDIEFIGGYLSASRARAIGAWLLEDNQTAAELFELALATDRESLGPTGIAWISADYAEFLVERNTPGDREKATELQDEAIAITTELGMKPLLERVLTQRETLTA